jgi:NTE family protein
MPPDPLAPVRPFGLVLSGGAARGAWQAGVLRYLLRTLPKSLGVVPWPEVVSGTSVGALNGIFVAPRSEPYLVYLSRVWQRMRIPDIYTVHAADLWGALMGHHRGQPGSALLDPEPLYRLVADLFPAEQVRQSIDSGLLRALIISATDLQTGHNTLFLDTADPEIDLDPPASARVVRGPTRPEHLLASSALPFLFPPISLDGRRYVDGGLRQNTPLRPVLHTGVDRILVISAHATDEGSLQLKPAAPEVVPTLPFLAGKSLNALMADPVDRDLLQLQRTNDLIDWGVAAYGPGFAEKLAEERGLRKVEVLVIRPGVDLGAMAADSFRAHPPPDVPQLRWLLNQLVDRGGPSDLLSYLYFDREFTGRAEAQGHADARAMAERLARFLLAG